MPGETTTTTLPDCGNRDVVFRLDGAAGPIDHLQFVANFPTAYGRFVGGGSDMACASLVEDASFESFQSPLLPWVRLAPPYTPILSMMALSVALGRIAADTFAGSGW
jgi:hypothetical protein